MIPWISSNCNALTSHLHSYWGKLLGRGASVAPDLHDGAIGVGRVKTRWQVVLAHEGLEGRDILLHGKWRSRVDTGEECVEHVSQQIRECLNVRVKVAVVGGDHKQILSAGNHEKPGKMNGTYFAECGINGSLVLGEIVEYCLILARLNRQHQVERTLNGCGYRSGGGR